MGNVQMEADQIRFKNASYGNVQTALSAALTGGGSTSLAALTDTDITTPSNGQVLTYDGTAEKWVNSSSSGGDANVYSTTETKIGTYNGHDLYRKLYTNITCPNDTTESVASGLENVDVVRIYGKAKSQNTVLPLPYTVSSNIASSIQLVYDDAIKITAGSDRTPYTADIVLEYIKVTPPSENNNR